MDALDCLRLGDIVTVPPRGPLSLRASASVNCQGSSWSFAVLGECDSALLDQEDAAWVLLPAPGMPDPVRWGQALAEGSCAFWAPHLPAAAGDAGQLLWRLVRPPGAVVPSLVTWRGPDRMVFVPVHQVPSSGIGVLRMPTGPSSPAHLPQRAAAQVAPVARPATPPARTLAQLAAARHVAAQ